MWNNKMKWRKFLVGTTIRIQGRLGGIKFFNDIIIRDSNLRQIPSPKGKLP